MSGQKKYRIAYIVGTYPALSETFVRNELREVSRSGFDILVLALRPRNEKEAKLVDEPEKVNVVYLDSIYRKGIHRLIKHFVTLIKSPARYLRTLAWVLLRKGPWRLFKAAPFLLDYLEGVEWMHGTFAWDQAAMAMVLSRLAGIPFSFTARAADIFIKPKYLHLLLAEAEFVATISNYNRDFLSQRYPFAKSKIHVIHSGHYPERFNFECSPPSDHLRITAVGRLIEKKGFTYLVKAMALLKGSFDYPLKCTIIGGGELEERLQKEIDELGINDVVELAGPLGPEEVLQRMASSHMVVQPCVQAKSGDQDGIPNVLMEAMWLGVPVISTRLSGIPELVEHERTGLLASPEDADELAEHMELLARDPGLRDLLATAARVKVSNEFNVSQETLKLTALIRNKLNQCFKSTDFKKAKRDKTV